MPLYLVISDANHQPCSIRSAEYIKDLGKWYNHIVLNELIQTTPAANNPTCCGPGLPSTKVDKNEPVH